MASVPHLETIRASVSYWPQPRTEVALVTAEEVAEALDACELGPGYGPSRGSRWHYLREGWEARYIRLGTLDLHARVLGLDPAHLDKHPDFWREVLDLAFAFEEHDWPRIRAFYLTYGALGYPNEELKDIYGEVPDSLEPCGWAAMVLSWFQKLTSLVSWCKEGKTGPLKDVLGSVGVVEHLKPVYFHQGPLGYEIRFIPWSAGETDKVLWRGPETEEELIWAGWCAAREAIGWELRQASLTLQETVVGKGVRTPTLFWGFAAFGKAFQAAFLQWFFQEVAYVDVRNCLICHSYRFEPGRTLYCSARCARTRKKQQDRARIALVSELLGRGKTPARIVRQVRAQLGIKTTEAAVLRLRDKVPHR
jgi:hypothetical protein